MWRCQNALTNVELYEALKPTVGEDAARLMASVVPAAENLATRDDVARVELKVSTLETKIEASTKELMRWMLVMFVPVWAGVWGTVVAVILKH